MPEATGEMGTIYLLHFTSPFKHARHYMGWTDELTERMNAHRKGNGSNLIRHLIKSGLDFEIARTWIGDRNQERYFKNIHKRLSGLCPVCKGRPIATRRSRQ